MVQTQQHIEFMLIDIDYQITNRDTAPTIRLFGKTEDKKVLVLVKDFLPYFYVTRKKGFNEFIESDKVISNWMMNKLPTSKKRYFGGEELDLVKIFGSHPEETPRIRKRFESNGFEVHEADIPFVKRFLLDTELGGLNVISAKGIIIEETKDAIKLECNFRELNQKSSELLNSAADFYKLKLLAFDIEVDHQNETIQQLLEQKEKRIIAISYIYGTKPSDATGKAILLEKDNPESERKLLLDFIEEINKIQPDVILTFNGDNFDIPYLLSRMKKLDVPSELLSMFQMDSVFYSRRSRCYRIKGRIVDDISPRTWGIHPISGKKGLDDIAETILGVGKIKLARTTGQIWRSGFIDKKSNTDRKKLKEYSLRDSQLTYDLLWKLGIPGWLEVIRLTGYPPGEAPGSTERIQGEFELMRFTGKQQVLIPSAPSDKEVNRRRIERRKNPHTGGTVLIPKGTLHYGVIISDFRSMYPSVCVAHNIGGETLKRFKDLDNVNPLDLFHQKPQSCLSLMEETLIKRRELTKKTIEELNEKITKTTNKTQEEKLLEQRAILDKEQYSLKIVANSMYGSHNYIRSRFYSITLGNAITNIARTYILRMDELLEEVSKKIQPVEIVYGDTDSAFIRILDPNLVLKIMAENNTSKKEKMTQQLLQLATTILAELNKKFPEAMELTLEDIAYKLIFKPGRAKAYSYYSILRNELKITGFEAVRSDWSFLSRESQKKVLEIILTENRTEVIDSSDLDLGITKAREYLIQLGMKILKMSNEELKKKSMILSPIKKKPSEYKTKVPAVQAFLHFAKREGLDPEEDWKEYDKFPWIITKGKGILSDRARHPKYVKHIDREHYITEILRASEGFGVKVTLQEIKNKLTTEPIDEIFARLPKNSDKEQDTENNWSIKKQTKINQFFQEKEQ